MRHHPTLAIAAILLAATLLSACGTKGPLTQLPTRPQTPATQAPQADDRNDLNTAAKAPR